MCRQSGLETEASAWYIFATNLFDLLNSVGIAVNILNQVNHTESEQMCIFFFLDLSAFSLCPLIHTPVKTSKQHFASFNDRN